MEKKYRPKFSVHQIADGLEFGSGTISGRDAGAELLTLVEQTIHTDPDILVPIGLEDDGKPVDDDGCGDGRGVLTVFTDEQRFKRSLDRSKVFGGAATMTAAIIIGTHNSYNAPLNEVFDAAIEELEESGLNYGAHTDEHASGDNCGCGAIDRAPEACMAAVKYEQPIRNVIKALGLPASQLDTVYKNYGEYVRTSLPELKAFKGSDVMKKVVAASKVVKQLAGAHHEKRIVLNQVRGYTVNQGLIRTVSEDQAQIFAVDIWRLQDIADRTVGADPQMREQALLSEVVYTLAVAAVLTKGDLPVDVIAPVE